MRAINTILLLAAFIALYVPLHAKTASSQKTSSSAPSFDEENFQQDQSGGAKEVFVYNPHTHLSNGPGEMGSLPLSHEDDEALDEKNETASIRPNFENADLESFINFVAQLTKINVIPTKDTQGVKISLNMRSNLTKKEVWEVFLTVTEMAGFTINRSGNVYKVLKQETKKTEPLPAYINVQAHHLPDSDQSIRFVTFLRNIQASDVEPLLKNMLGAGGDLLRQDNMNGFIITDKCHNIKSAMTILNELDNGGLQEMYKVITLKKTDATEVKQLLDDMTKNASDKSNNAIVARLLGKVQESSEYFSASTKIIVEDRSNSLILLGNQKSIKKIEDFIAKYIEREEQEVDSPIHRYQLEYTDANDVKMLLDNIVNSQSDSGAEQYGGVRNGGKYFKKMRFEVDASSNALLISSLDKGDWKLLKKTIQDLDKPQPQVSIETLIVDIDLQGDMELASQIRSPRADQPFPNLTWQSAAAASTVFGTAGGGAKTLLGDLTSVLSGLSQGTAAFALSKGVGNVWAIFTALSKNLNTSLVDNSFITIANRVPATLTVGQTQRILAQTYAGYTGNSNSYADKTAATTFSYTPQINADGLINLNIQIQMSDFVGSNGNTTNKNYQSTLACADGQVLALGGLVKTKVADAQTDGMPFLSNIPVLGWLFKDKERSTSKTYTFFFICPTILKPRQKPGIDMYTKMKLHRARREVESSVLTAKTSDPVHNLFFNGSGENYHHKVDDFANARFQPSSVDIKHDPFYNPGIYDKQQIDFKDEFDGDSIVQKIRADRNDPAPEAAKTPPAAKIITADSLKAMPTNDKKSPAKVAAVKEKALPKSKPAKPQPISTPKDSILKKLSESLAHKQGQQLDQPAQAPQPTKQAVLEPEPALEIPPLPPISHEKRDQFKTVFESAQTTQGSTLTPISIGTRRNALKELIGGSAQPLRYRQSVAEELPQQPIVIGKNATGNKVDPIETLIADQEAKRAKFKQSLTLGDANSKPDEAPLVTRRKSLKELLASYPSSLNNSPASTQSPQRQG